MTVFWSSGHTSFDGDTNWETRLLLAYAFLLGHEGDQVLPGLDHLLGLHAVGGGLRGVRVLLAVVFVHALLPRLGAPLLTATTSLLLPAKETKEDESTLKTVLHLHAFLVVVSLKDNPRFSRITSALRLHSNRCEGRGQRFLEPELRLTLATILVFHREFAPLYNLIHFSPK